MKKIAIALMGLSMSSAAMAEPQIQAFCYEDVKAPSALSGLHGLYHGKMPVNGTLEIQSSVASTHNYELKVYAKGHRFHTAKYRVVANSEASFPLPAQDQSCADQSQGFTQAQGQTQCTTQAQAPAQQWIKAPTQCEIQAPTACEPAQSAQCETQASAQNTQCATAVPAQNAQCATPTVQNTAQQTVTAPAQQIVAAPAQNAQCATQTVSSVKKAQCTTQAQSSARQDWCGTPTTAPAQNAQCAAPAQNAQCAAPAQNAQCAAPAQEACTPATACDQSVKVHLSGMGHLPHHDKVTLKMNQTKSVHFTHHPKVGDTHTPVHVKCDVTYLGEI